MSPKQEENQNKCMIRTENNDVVWNKMRYNTQLWFILSISLEWSLNSQCGNDFGMRIILLLFRVLRCWTCLFSLSLIFMSLFERKKKPQQYAWSCCCCTILLLLSFYGIANSTFYMRVYNIQHMYCNACNEHRKREWIWKPLFFASIAKHIQTHTHTYILVYRSNTQPFDQVLLPHQTLSLYSCDFYTIFTWSSSLYTFTCV